MGAQVHLSKVFSKQQSRSVKCDANLVIVGVVSPHRTPLFYDLSGDVEFLEFGTRDRWVASGKCVMSGGLRLEIKSIATIGDVPTDATDRVYNKGVARPSWIRESPEDRERREGGKSGRRTSQ